MANEAKQQKEQEATPVWDIDAEDERVCVLHRGWRKIDAATGEMLLPTNRETFFDRVTFMGGVAYNVPVETARGWIKAGFIDKNMVFKNDSTTEDFETRTGRYLVSKGFGNVADFTPEKIMAALGPEKAAEFARALQRHITHRKEGEGKGHEHDRST